MNIGGKLRRTRSENAETESTRTEGAAPRAVHLAQILASTRDEPFVPAETILGRAS